MQVIKMRGQAQIPGLHTFRITDAGVQVFPRTIVAVYREGKLTDGHAEFLPDRQFRFADRLRP